MTSDPELAKRPYLLELYDHPTFIVRNLIRQWGGWWNGNAADLMPATAAAQAAEIAALAGGVAALVTRGRTLLADGDRRWPCTWPNGRRVAHRETVRAQALKRDVYERRMAETPNLMMNGVYRDAMNDARAALGEERLSRTGVALAL